MIGTDCAGAILVSGEEKTTVGPIGPARIFDDVRRPKAPGPPDGPEILHRLCRNPRPMREHRSPVCSSSDEGLRPTQSVHIIEIWYYPLNLPLRGKPFGTVRPAVARSASHSASSSLFLANTRPALSSQVRPSAMAKHLASRCRHPCSAAGERPCHATSPAVAPAGRPASCDFHRPRRRDRR